MRDAGWRRITLIALAIVVVLAVAAGGLFWWRNEVHANEVKRYKSAASLAWNKIAQGARQLSATMLKVGSPADLAGVASEAARLQGEVSKRVDSLEGKGAPPGYSDTVAKETTALKSLVSYLQGLSDIASKGDPSQLVNDRSTLDDLARQAQDDTNEFLSAAKWLGLSINNDFYLAGQTLQTAFEPPDPAKQADAQAVYDTTNAFMNADIFHRDFDTIWSMISTRLHTGFDFYKITKETIAAGWEKAWGDHRPVSFYVSRSSVAFPSPGHATVRAIAYLDKGGVRIEEIQLVNEGGVWKLDSYPFVGWYGP